MKHIKQIELIFENCEVMDVTNSVGDFDIEDITTELHRVASNAISKINTANLINFQIYGDGEIKYHMFDNITPIERLLKYNDITSIDITYDDNTIESFYTNFDGEELNKNQTTKLYKGDVFIVISPDKTVDDIYTEDLLDDLINSKEFCMNNDVAAINELKENNWQVLYKNNNYIQLFNNDVANIILNKDDTNILFLNSNKNYIIPNKIMYDICNLVFELCFIKYSLSEEKIREYEYININSDSIFDRNKTGNTTIEFNFILHKHFKCKLQFNRDKDDLNNSDLFEGYLIIEDNKLYIKDVYNLMWILHTYLPDEFWS